MPIRNAPSRPRRSCAFSPSCLAARIERKVDLVHVTLELFVRARISFRAVSRVLGVLAAPLGLAKAHVLKP